MCVGVRRVNDEKREVNTWRRGGVTRETWQQGGQRGGLSIHPSQSFQCRPRFNIFLIQICLWSATSQFLRPGISVFSKLLKLVPRMSNCLDPLYDNKPNKNKLVLMTLPEFQLDLNISADSLGALQGYSL